MGYAKELAELLEPLRLYRVDGGVSGAELAGVGEVMDQIQAALETAELNAIPVTAGDAGLSAWETLLPFRPASTGQAARRAALQALLRIDEASFTLSAINDTLRGCGINATVTETATPQQVEVRFPGVRGIPGELSALQLRIEQILPCHLGVAYLFAYLRWFELESLFRRWDLLQQRCPNWNALEREGGMPA